MLLLLDDMGDVEDDQKLSVMTHSFDSAPEEVRFGAFTAQSVFPTSACAIST